MDLTGRTTLAQAMALISRCHAFVTNDSGLMHVAAALAAPTVAIFGSTNPVTTGPFSVESSVVRSDLACSPCLETHCPKKHFQCMKTIGVDECPPCRPASTGSGQFMNQGPRPAVFLDRDGTINEQMGYINHLSRFRLLPGVVEAIRLLNAQQVPVVVVTNQSGLARGYFPRTLLDEVHATMKGLLAEQGAWLDGLYVCPHHPEAKEEQYRKNCNCRKPRTGLLEQAAAELNLDLAGRSGGGPLVGHHLRRAGRLHAGAGADGIRAGGLSVYRARPGTAARACRRDLAGCGALDPCQGFATP